jgi:hypothetical protein
MEQLARYRSEWLMIRSSLLSIDGKIFSLYEYVRSSAGAPSTMPVRPPGYAAAVVRVEICMEPIRFRKPDRHTGASAPGRCA